MCMLVSLSTSSGKLALYSLWHLVLAQTADPREKIKMAPGSFCRLYYIVAKNSLELLNCEMCKCGCPVDPACQQQ